MNKRDKKESKIKDFKDLGLAEKTLDAIKRKGFESPTDIQAKVIPYMLKDETDIIGQAQTGTGKTAAFALPIIEKIEKRIKQVQVIILAPTRELAIQICEEINSLKGKKQLGVVPIYGGQSIERQFRSLKEGKEIVVGTPGRVLDHLRRKSLNLDHVSHFILDEADEMLNMGFIEDVESILDAAPNKRRVLLFSATMPQRIKKLSEKYMNKDYVHIKIKSTITVDLTDQIYFEVPARNKFEALTRIIDIEDEFYGLIFCRTKNDVDELAGQLQDRGYSADALHGDISQSQREKILQKFRRKNITTLVATDVAARGIDVIDLTHVINYSIPHNPEAYIHRIGRTGRAGKKGTAVTFITPSEFRKLGFIKRITKADIQKKQIPDISEVIGARKGRINIGILEELGVEQAKIYTKWAKKLLKMGDPADILALVLKRAYGNILDKDNYKELSEYSHRKSEDKPGTIRLFIAKGKNNNLTKRQLVDFIINKAKVPQRLIDDVQLFDSFSFITVPFVEAEIILEKFRVHGKRQIVEKAKKKNSTYKKRRKKS